MIKYKKGSLFTADEDRVLVHACNSLGVWGKGIAAEFKIRYPIVYEEYRGYCVDAEYPIIGTCYVDSYGEVASLITSHNFGKNIDSKEEILVNTTLALDVLCQGYFKKFASNKFNSGLFRVPWEETEKILKVFVKRYDLDWEVYEA